MVNIAGGINKLSCDSFSSRNTSSSSSRMC